jgi:hypothetical protein
MKGVIGQVMMQGKSSALWDIPVHVGGVWDHAVWETKSLAMKFKRLDWIVEDPKVSFRTRKRKAGWDVRHACRSENEVGRKRGGCVKSTTAPAYVGCWQ